MTHRLVHSVGELLEEVLNILQIPSFGILGGFKKKMDTTSDLELRDVKTHVDQKNRGTVSCTSDRAIGFDQVYEGLT